MTVTVHPSHVPWPIPIDDVCFGLVCGRPPTWVYPTGQAVLFACDDHAQMLRDGSMQVEVADSYEIALGSRHGRHRKSGRL